jgi:hypothetical protein
VENFLSPDLLSVSQGGIPIMEVMNCQANSLDAVGENTSNKIAQQLSRGLDAS